MSAFFLSFIKKTLCFLCFLLYNKRLNRKTGYKMTHSTTNKRFFNKGLLKDVHLALFVMTIAGCGLIYQYLLASYSGRVLGSMEKVIFIIMTLMIVFMGVGSFIVKHFKNKFLWFSILESAISITALSTIFIISGAHALAFQLPNIIAATFGIPADLAPEHGFVENITVFLNSLSYIMAGILGFLLGMEIPFLAAIREELHGEGKLENNVGIIYGVDYLGAGIGAFIWIFGLIQLDIADALKYVTYTNVLVGFFFILSFKGHIKKVKTALFVQFFTAATIFFACQSIGDWQKMLEQSMFRDTIVYTENTQFQKFTVTRSHNKYSGEVVESLFINGKTQFSSADEGVYHSLLTMPVLTAANNPDHVLMIGGGDGLGLRDILKSNPKSVTVLDLDERLVNFFKEPVYDNDGKQVNAEFIAMNERSFHDERVSFMFGDAFLNIKKLMQQNKKFGAIIIDLPDPSHPDLNKLYSKTFYKMVNQVMTNEGAVSIQSSSPYLSKEAFVSIGQTLNASGFHTEQYQHQIPSFGGQWGWTIGTKSLPTAKVRIASSEKLSTDDEWLTKNKLLSTFEFGKNYYKNIDNIKVNTIDNNATYLYYQQAWERLTKSAFE